MSQRPGQNISPQGEDAKTNEIVVPAGTELNPGSIGILAFAGCHSVPVRRAPRVAILATGDELVEPNLPAVGAQIRNSNSYQLLAQCAEKHWQTTYLGIARDTIEETRRRLIEGLSYDLLITTGGVSVGEHDYVGRVLEELGVKLAFNKVAIKPGKPTTYGVKDQTLVFGLPGNPVAAFVCFHIFVRTAVRKALGAKDPLPRFHTFPSAAHLKSPGDRATFQPARLVTENGAFETVESLRWHGSGHLAALLSADALLLQEANTAIEAGQGVRTLLL
jgi:molybdopterin molybdotransferase